MRSFSMVLWRPNAGTIEIAARVLIDESGDIEIERVCVETRGARFLNGLSIARSECDEE